MKTLADHQLHSKFAMATGEAMNLEQLASREGKVRVKPDYGVYGVPEMG